MTSKKKVIKGKGKSGLPEIKKSDANFNGMQSIDKLIAVLLIAAIGLLPLLARVKLVQFVSPKIIHDLIGTGIKGDIFTYYKWVFLLCLSALAVGLLIWKVVVCRFDLRRNYINLPIMVLVFLTVLSGLSSDFLSISLFGMYNRHEGTLTYLCYFALFFIAANTSFKEWFNRYIFLALYVIVTINLLIILLDFYGNDLLNNQAVRSVIVPSYLPETGMQGHLNSTLSNPNYVSGFSASLTAFFLVAALMERNHIRRLIYGVFAVFSFTMLLASLSASGFVTLVILLPVIFTLAFLNQKRLQCLITGGVVLTACAAVMLILNVHNPRVWNESVGSFKGIGEYVKKEISFKPVMSELKYTLLPRQSEAATYSKVTSNKEVPGEGITESDNINEEFNLPKPSESPGTGRTYIWQKTIDLIMERPLLGHGRETLAYYFPQNDRDIIANLSSYDEIVTKPHNFYLEVAFSSGIFALLALVLLFIQHLYYTIRLQIISKKNLMVLPAALFVFFCAFLIQWMFNDSIIATSIIFWVLFGVAVSFNTEQAG